MENGEMILNGSGPIHEHNKLSLNNGEEYHQGLCWKQVNFDTDWGTVRGKKVGNGGRKILAVHGWLDNANSFDLVAPYFTNDCTLITIDLPGHGWSDHFPKGFVYDIRGYLLAVKKVIQNIGWSKFTYLGHSMGALVGIMYCSVFPEDVDTFISIDIIKSWSLEPASYATTLRSNILNYFKNEALSKKPALEYDEEELMALTIEGPTRSLDEKSARVLMERSTRVNNCSSKLTLTRDLRVKAYFIGFIPFDGWFEYARSITCPILIIMAKDGRKYGSEADNEIMRNAFKEGCPLFHYQELGGKHHLHLTNAEAVGPVIKKFIQESDSLINIVE